MALTIAELQCPKGGARCAYALRDKVLYVGATAETVARILRARGGRTLADQPDLAAHVKAGASAGLFIYADLAMQSAALLRLAKAIPAMALARGDDDAAAFLAGAEHPAFTPWARSGGVAFLETYYRDGRAGLRLEWTGTEPAKLLRETVRMLMGRVEGGR